MLDIKNTNKSSFIQRGVLLPPAKDHNNILIDDPDTSRTTLTEKARSSLLKNYLMRK
jgi:hypothetical protein